MSVDWGVQMPQVGLEEVPRPVVAFLLGGCKLRPRDALADCLRELSDESLVRYETDPAGLPVFSLGADSPRSGRPLLAFEQVALARVRSRAGRMGRVPYSALISDDGDSYKDWRRRQQEELGREAERADLAEKSAPKGSWLVAGTLAALTETAVVILHSVDWKLADRIAPPVIVAGFLMLLVPWFLRRWRLTPEGAAAVEAWRRAGRGLPGGARGLAADPDRTVWALDGPGGAALPKGYAWSSLGGQWHTVRLGETLSPPYWSTASGLRVVLSLTFFGSIVSVMIGGTVLGFDPLGQLIAITPAGLAVVAIITLWLPAVRSRMRLPDAVIFTGEIVRVEYIEGEDGPDRHLVWIDDGSRVTMKFGFEAGRYQRISVGNLVQVNWSPRRRALNGITSPDGAGTTLVM
jgi:hypothetical protein